MRSAIERGDVYQVNLVQHLSAPFRGNAAGLAERLSPLDPLHPAPLEGDGWAIVSASPELFLSRRGRTLTTRPIKGTRPLDDAAELHDSEKDAAEHTMIVDLERNDLARVCEPGSVRWPELMAEEQLAGVAHLVSTVQGTLREGVTLPEILRATFPGGSITGAPKIAAVDLIAALEPVGRGASMGALGTIYPNGDFDLALTIRTFALADGRIHLWVGGGIVWDSDPDEEIEESWVKARPLLQRIGSRVRRCPRDAPRRRRPRPGRRGGGRAGSPRRRPGLPPRTRGVRDRAGVRRAPVPAGRITSSGSQRRPSASACARWTASRSSPPRRSRRRARTRRCSASTGRPAARTRTSRPGSRSSRRFPRGWTSAVRRA